MSDHQGSSRVQAVRSFNRFYTRQIGLLNAGFLNSPFSLAEVRVIYELAQAPATTATALGRQLSMDAGQLSRILTRLMKHGLVARRRSPADGRQADLSMTAAGREAFALLNERQASQVEQLLSGLPPADQERVVRAMHRIQQLLSPASERPAPVSLRSPRAGDMGWVVQAHGRIYAEEYGWNQEFEGLVASITAEFIKNFDPKRERCWIAERDGENVGSIFLVRYSESVAKLRLFLVDPGARGLGIGKRLVAECVRFAREAGYRKITLWTNDVLVAARQIYRQTGFKLVESEPYHGFGQELVSETWELEL